MNLFSNIKKRINPSFSFFLGVAIALSNATSAAAFKINFNYDYDDNNFFDDTTPEGKARRATLEQAGQYYENYLNDNLSAIVEDTSSTVGIGYEWGSPQRKNTWTISFPHPATGIQTTIDNPTFAQDEITIYVGGRDLSSLGTGGAGGLGYPIYGDGNGNVLNQDFIDLIKGRGQTGALTNPATDLSLWGGSIAFDNNLNSGYSWHNKISTSELDSSEYDFLSIAIHEIGHTLGFGKDSWDAQISGTDFTGTYSIDAYNKANEPSVTAVPLDASLSHWSNGTNGLTLQGIIQEAALDPSILNGQRKVLTNLDYGGLLDIGWDVDRAAIYVNVPFEFSPALGILLTLSWFSLLKIRKKYNKPRLYRKP